MLHLALQAAEPATIIGRKGLPSRSAAIAEEVATVALLRFGVLELHLRTGEMRKSGKLIRLAPQPFRLLVLLASKPGDLVTREEIQREIWGDGTVVDDEQGLRFVIGKVRAALGDNSNSPRYIETLPRRGYRFIVQVTAENYSVSPSTAGTAARGKHPILAISRRRRFCSRTLPAANRQPGPRERIDE